MAGLRSGEFNGLLPCKARWEELRFTSLFRGNDPALYSDDGGRMGTIDPLEKDSDGDSG